MFHLWGLAQPVKTGCAIYFSLFYILILRNILSYRNFFPTPRKLKNNFHLLGSSLGTLQLTSEWFPIQVRVMKKEGREGKTAVVVGSITDDKRIFDIPKLKVRFFPFIVIWSASKFAETWQITSIHSNIHFNKDFTGATYRNSDLSDIKVASFSVQCSLLPWSRGSRLWSIQLFISIWILPEPIGS